MMKAIKYYLLTVIGLISNYGTAQQHKVELEKGNTEHFWMRYQNALTHYDSALSIKPDYFYAHFNSGNSYYRISEEAKDSLKITFANKAANKFESAIFSTSNKEFQSYGYYNQGNCFLSINELKQSIELYKDALRADPTNKNARYNLSYALLKLKAQEEAMENMQEQIDSLQKEIDENKEEQKENESSSKSKEEKQQKKNELEQKKEELEKKKQELEQQKQKGEQESQKKEDEQGEKQKSEQGKEGNKNEGEESKEGKEGAGDKKEGGTEQRQESFTLREAKQNLDALKNEEKKILLRINRNREGQRKRQTSKGTREEKDW